MSAEQAKKGRRRSVEINDTLFAWLEWYHEKCGIQSGPVSPWPGIWYVRVPRREKLHKEAENALETERASAQLRELSLDQGMATSTL